MKQDEKSKVILKTCAGLNKGDHLLIVYDPECDDESIRSVTSSAKNLGVIVEEEKIFGEVTREPPNKVASKMLEREVTLFCVNEKRTAIWGHSDAKANACKSGGRVLFLTQKINTTPSSQELLTIMRRSQRLGDLLEKTSTITIVSDHRFELTMKLKGRKALRLSSILTAPGSWGAVPDYSEAGIAPLEEESSGSFHADGMIVGLGRVDEPVDLDFKQGNLVRISGKKTADEFRKLIYSYPESARVLCEIGFGTNHLRKAVNGEFDDKKILGAVHIAMGDNHTFGGNNRADLHIDCMSIQPQVYFDGRKIEFSSL